MTAKHELELLAPQVHPLAKLLPEMDATDFAQFKRDIDHHGQLEPIVMLGGRILDGRHRAKAMRELGRTPVTVEYEGTDPAGFVLSRNVLRRHLSISQRALVAARLSNWTRQTAAQNWAIPQRSAARILNVSRGSLQTARRLLDAPLLVDRKAALITAVERGDLSVSLAEALCVFAPGDIDAVLELASDPPRMKQTALERIKRRAGANCPCGAEDCFITPIRIVEMVRQALGEIDLDPASCDAAQETTVNAATYFTPIEDGLQQDWTGRVWLSPPRHNDVLRDAFLQKALDEYRAGRASEIIILGEPHGIGERWFQALAREARAVFFPDGFPNSIFYLGPDQSRFESVFSKHGVVLAVSAASVSMASKSICLVGASEEKP